MPKVTYLVAGRGGTTSQFTRPALGGDSHSTGLGISMRKVDNHEQTGKKRLHDQLPAEDHGLYRISCCEIWVSQSRSEATLMRAALRVHRHFVSKPAFPEHQGSGFWHAAFVDACFARRGGHHHGVPWVFKDDGARPFRCCHIVGAAQNCVGVKVRGVRTALGQHIHPQGIAEEFAATQVPVHDLAKLAALAGIFLQRARA